jgi:hypothetical protein
MRMRIKLQIDWMGSARGRGIEQHKNGEEIDILLLPGIRLLRRGQAKWIHGHPEDQGFIPVEPFRMVKPEVDKMIRGALNK